MFSEIKKKLFVITELVIVTFIVLFRILSLECNLNYVRIGKRVSRCVFWC